MKKEEQFFKIKVQKVKMKKCKYCKSSFEPKRVNQIVCENIDCAIEYGKILNNKQKRISKKSFNQSDKSKLRELAQSVFNKYIRLRDKDLSCISCGHINGRQFHAGHFKPAGANPQLRFNELNCHKQCSICNNYKSGNLAEYRKNLILKIGLENVEMLESDNSVKKYTVEDYQNIIKIYKEKIKLLEV